MRGRGVEGGEGGGDGVHLSPDTQTLSYMYDREE